MTHNSELFIISVRHAKTNLDILELWGKELLLREGFDPVFYIGSKIYSCQSWHDYPWCPYGHRDFPGRCSPLASQCSAWSLLVLAGESLGYLFWPRRGYNSFSRAYMSSNDVIVQEISLKWQFWGPCGYYPSQKCPLGLFMPERAMTGPTPPLQHLL